MNEKLERRIRKTAIVFRILICGGCLTKERLTKQRNFTSDCRIFVVYFAGSWYV